MQQQGSDDPSALQLFQEDMSVYDNPVYDVLIDPPNYNVNYLHQHYDYQNDSYYLNQEQNPQWSENHVQESEQDQPGILLPFSFASEDDTAMLELYAEESDLASSFAPEDEAAEFDLNEEQSYPISATDYSGVIELVTFEFFDDDGNLDTYTTWVPVDDSDEIVQELVEENMISESNGLSEATIAEHLKIRNYRALANQEPEEICVVCQCEYENGETIGALECRHEYHADCIKRWLTEKNFCPVCKREAIQES